MKTENIKITNKLFFIIAIVWCICFVSRFKLVGFNFNLSTVFAIVILGLAFYISVRNKNNIFHLYLFSGYLFLSTLFSYIAFKELQPGSFAMLIKILILFPGGLLLAQAISEKKLKIVLNVYPYALLIFFLVMYVFTRLDYHILNWGRLCNVYFLGAPNTMGFLFALALLQLFFQQSHSTLAKYIKWICIILTMYILVGTFSRSAIWGLSLGIILSLLFCYRLAIFKNKFLYQFMVCFLVATILIANTFVPLVITKLRQVNHDVDDRYTVLYQGLTYSLMDNKIEVFQYLMRRYLNDNFSRLFPIIYPLYSKSVKHDEQRNTSQVNALGENLADGNVILDGKAAGKSLSFPGKSTSSSINYEFGNNPIFNQFSSGRSVLWRWIIKKVAENRISLAIGYGPGYLVGAVDTTPDSLIFMSLVSFGSLGLCWAIIFLFLLVKKISIRKMDERNLQKSMLSIFLIFVLITNNSVMAQQALLVSLFYFGYLFNKHSEK